MMEIICVYPKDDSTTFLEPIYAILSSFAKFRGFRIETEEECNTSIRYIENAKANSTIFFLGHGTAHELQYSSQKVYVDSSNFSIFKNKKLILLSCKSFDFIRVNKDLSETKNYITFDDLPSDEVEFQVLTGIHSTELSNRYNGLLVDSICKSLIDSEELKKGFLYFYRRIKLYINKNISQILYQKGFSDFRVLANILYETKEGIYYSGN